MMDEHAERGQIQDELFQLIENHAKLYQSCIPAPSIPFPGDQRLPPKARIHIERLFLQVGQSLCFYNYIMQISNCFLLLAQDPEAAEEIAETGIEKLHTLLNGLNDLMLREYSWCGPADDRVLSEAYWAYRKTRRAHLCQKKRKRSFKARPKRT